MPAFSFYLSEELLEYIKKRSIREDKLNISKAIRNLIMKGLILEILDRIEAFRISAKLENYKTAFTEYDTTSYEPYGFFDIENTAHTELFLRKTLKDLPEATLIEFAEKLNENKDKKIKELRPLKTGEISSLLFISNREAKQYNAYILDIAKSNSLFMYALVFYKKAKKEDSEA